MKVRFEFTADELLFIAVRNFTSSNHITNANLQMTAPDYRNSPFKKEEMEKFVLEFEDTSIQRASDSLNSPTLTATGIVN